MMKVASALALLGFCSLVEARIGAEQRSLQEEPPLQIVGNDGEFSVFPLELCMGECDTDDDCAEGLMCYQRGPSEPVPGCQDRGPGFDSKADYCVLKDDMPDVPVDTTDMPVGTEMPTMDETVDVSVIEEEVAIMAAEAATDAPMEDAPIMEDDEEPGRLVVPGNNGDPASAFPLSVCEGDCDNDEECEEGLICWMREYGDEVPGCVGGLLSITDFCVLAKYETAQEQVEEEEEVVEEEIDTVETEAPTMGEEGMDGQEGDMDGGMEPEEEEMVKTTAPTEAAGEEEDMDGDVDGEDGDMDVDMEAEEEDMVKTVAPTEAETMAETVMASSMEDTEAPSMMEDSGNATAVDEAVSKAGEES